MVDPDRRDQGNAIAQRYGAAAAGEWQLVLNHFELGEGFALIVLVVPDRDGARLCRDELAGWLGRHGRRMVALEPASPDGLRQLAARVLEVSVDAGLGAVWIAAVEQRSAPDYADWDAAWRRLLGGLNQQRNPLRRRFECPLVIVGPDWLVPLFREIAPDLWSVRTQVVHIEPDRAAMAAEPVDAGPLAPAHHEELRSSNESAADPALALHEAARLRGVAGREHELAAMLRRAGGGLVRRGEFAAAEAVLREAADVLLQQADSNAAGDALHELGHVVRLQGRTAEAAGILQEALERREQAGAFAFGRGNTLLELARAAVDLGDLARAAALLREVVALDEKGNVPADSRGITLNDLGLVLQGQGQAEAAEAALRQALALKLEGGASARSRSGTLHDLGRLLAAQGRMPEAERAFREALGLAEEGGAPVILRRALWQDLGRALRALGRAREAEEAFRHVLTLAEAGDDAAGWRSTTTIDLARALLDQGRAEEAKELLAQTLALQQQAGATQELQAVTRGLLARALRRLGRESDADRALAEDGTAARNPGSTGVESRRSFWQSAGAWISRNFRRMDRARR
jgi:tetratricopeptide (TPR) repeat protein